MSFLTFRRPLVPARLACFIFYKFPFYSCGLSTAHEHSSLRTRSQQIMDNRGSIPVLLRFPSRSYRPSRSLASSCVRARSLTTNGEPFSVSQATVTSDVHQTLDVRTDFSPQITFDNTVSLNNGRNLANLLFCQVPNPNIRVNGCCFQYPFGQRSANSINVRQTYLDPFVSGQIHPNYTCQSASPP